MKSNCRALHETVLRDLFDLVDYIKNNDYDDLIDKKKGKMSSTSIAKLTDNLVLVFPVMVSTSLTIDTAVMLMKALERKYVTMIQMLFSAYQVQDVQSMQEIIDKFHRNIKLGRDANVDTFITAMDDWLGESKISTNVDKVLVEAVRQDMKNINFYLEESINSKPISEFTIRRDSYNRSIFVEDEKPDSGKKTDAKSDATLASDTVGVSKDSINKKKDKKYKPTTNQLGVKDYSDINNKTLLPADIKKANELMPTMMSVTYVYQKDEDSPPISVENAVIGVKARLIPCDSNDIITHLMNKVQDRNWLLQYIRATTREISFARDFLLCVDRAKIDALSHSRRGSSNPMWKVLERRAIGSRIRRLLGSNNPNMAITTLAVSQEDVDRALKEYSVSFENPRIVEPLFDNLNLMGIVIADESLEVAKFMFDTGDGNWENYSFTSLERENQDNTYKKVINLMTKVAR